MKKKFNWRIFGTIFGAGAFVVSAYFTCDLLIAEATLGREKLVHFLWGLVCQGFLAFFCTAMFVTEGPKRIIYGSLFLLALVLSLQGTIAQRAMNRQSQLNGEISNDSDYTDLKKKKARLEAKIDKFDEAILGFRKDFVIKNGATPTEEKLKEAKEQLADTEKKLANYSHKTGSEANAPFIAWARFCNEDATDEELTKIAENSHMWVTIGYAVLLDVGGPVAFGAVISPHVGNVIRRRRKRRAEEYENEDEIEEPDHVRTAARGHSSSYSSHTSNSHTPSENKPSNQPDTNELETIHVDSVDMKLGHVDTNIDRVNTAPNQPKINHENTPENQGEKRASFDPEKNHQFDGLKTIKKKHEIDSEKNHEKNALPRAKKPSKKTMNSNHEITPKKTINFDPEKDTKQTMKNEGKNSAGFRAKFQVKKSPQKGVKKISVYSHDLLPQYIKALFNPPKKNGSLQGWKRTGSTLNYTQKVSQLCHEECRGLGLTVLKRVAGKQFSYPTMGEKDMLKVVKKVHAVG